MGADWLDLTTLAKFLQRDARDLEKMAERERIPGRKVGGAWRFTRDEINHWLETEMAGLSDRELEGLEVGVRGVSSTDELPLLVGSHLEVNNIALPLEARTKPAVIQKLIEAANGTWQIYDVDKVHSAVRAREELASTALPGGIAIPHMRRPLPDAVGEHLIAFGRTLSGIPFGGGHNELTDLFFLVLCRDDRMHLQVLARLARMIQRPGFLDALREAETPRELHGVVSNFEREVLA